jgi:hypothetical protein
MRAFLTSALEVSGHLHASPPGKESTMPVGWGLGEYREKIRYSNVYMADSCLIPNIRYILKAQAYFIVYV